MAAVLARSCERVALMGSYPPTLATDQHGKTDVEIKVMMMWKSAFFFILTKFIKNCVLTAI